MYFLHILELLKFILYNKNIFFYVISLSLKFLPDHVGKCKFVLHFLT